jgi:hypothetical protein
MTYIIPTAAIQIAKNIQQTFQPDAMEPPLTNPNFDDDCLMRGGTTIKLLKQPSVVSIGSLHLHFGIFEE